MKKNKTENIKRDASWAESVEQPGELKWEPVFISDSVPVRISYSLIQALKQTHCPFQVYFMSIIKSHSLDNENMLRGQYFEAGCLGSTASGDTTIELEKLDSGKKSADHQRIDQQIENFKKVCKDYGIRILSKQVRLEHKSDQFDYPVSGIIDGIGTIVDRKIIDEIALSIENNIFSQSDDDIREKRKEIEFIRQNGLPHIFDLKLTRSISKSVGDWSWKYPQNIPSTQPAILTWLAKEQLNISYPFYYFVFDYSPEMDYNIIRKVVSQLDIAEMLNDIADTETKLKQYSKEGFGFNPEYYRCKSCPFNQGKNSEHNCKHAINIKPITYV